MKYPKIEALVPAGEHFDETAMNSEGIWLTPPHVDAIEVSLSQAIEAGATAATQIGELNGQVENLNAQVASSATALESANAEIVAKDAEIESLNAQIAELKKVPAGEFNSTTREEDNNSNKPDPKEKYFKSSWNQQAQKYAK